MNYMSPFLLPAVRASPFVLAVDVIFLFYAAGNANQLLPKQY